MEITERLRLLHGAIEARGEQIEYDCPSSDMFERFSDVKHHAAQLEADITERLFPDPGNPGG